ncbi:MAG TPA: MarR family winged helix-turn-helix transcriptional regulator [Cyclobacteriaceae bacterium]|jgi:DNA-binding MarR family transcriptional regulator|nr:MarR family winged helix-turn-helix transcriptional regulator [Cyclobacteriaceae bacterium]
MHYQNTAGLLILGSRFRRLSESFLTAINMIYRKQRITFEAGWFPVFYLLAQQDSLTVNELSEAMRCSQPTASQLVRSLKEKGFITSAIHPHDARSQEIILTKKGKQLLARLRPVWLAMEKTFEEHFETSLLKKLTSLEKQLESEVLAEKVNKKLAS